MPAVMVAEHTTHSIAVSSPAAAETIASIHRTYPQRDGQAEWAFMDCIHNIQRTMHDCSLTVVDNHADAVPNCE